MEEVVSELSQEEVGELQGIFGSVDDPKTKQIIFDRFLTYRRRMARLAAVQALYLHDLRLKTKALAQSQNLFNDGGDKLKIDALSLCQEVVFFYRNVFFTSQEYGWTKKNKKIDENFMFEIVNTALSNLVEIDDYIAKHLNPNWTVEKLDTVLRSIIRCAIAEIFIGEPIEKAVLSSEYTNLASNFFDGKEIGFINGITDKLYDRVVKDRPFKEKTEEKKTVA